MHNRIRFGVIKFHHKHHKKSFWISLAIIIAAAAVLVGYEIFEVKEGSLHHLAVAVLAERIAGIQVVEGE